VSSKVATTILCALLALNLIVLDLIWPLPLLRVAGLRALQLEKDPDFVPAVRAIVQKCRGTRGAVLAGRGPDDRCASLDIVY
jgi:hypothetical protein